MYEHRVGQVAVPRDAGDEAFGSALDRMLTEEQSDGWELVSTNLHVYNDVMEMWLFFKRSVS